MFYQSRCLKNTRVIKLSKNLHSRLISEKNTNFKLLLRNDHLPRSVTSLVTPTIRHYHQTFLTNEDIQKKRGALYDTEVKRQNSLITDIEKIEVQYKGFPEDCTLMMNRYISTPVHCAQHLHQLIVDRSVIAEVDGDPWDMCRPLTDNCTLRFLHFKEADPYYVNKAFWRSLSLMLGSVLENSFKNDVFIQLCSFPPPKVRTGSFVYDVDISLDAWTPTMDEMRVFSTQMVKLSLANQPFQRLEVDAKLALRMFEDNKYKEAQIPHIAAQSKSGNTVTLYRVGDFIDISRGPIIGRTGHLSKCTITAVLPIETNQGSLYRVQGIALPKGLHVNFYSYSILEERARNLNSGRVPNLGALFGDVSTSRPVKSHREQ